MVRNALARSIVSCLALCLLALAACSPVGTPDPSDSVTDGPASEGQDEAGPGAQDALAAFEALHPGFTGLSAEADGPGWKVLGRSDVIPEFLVQHTVVPIPDGDVTATVGDTVWTASRGLQEVTQNAQLMPGDMASQLMREFVSTVGWDAQQTDAFVTYVAVISNMDMRIDWQDASGAQTSTSFVLDLASGDWVAR